MKGFVVLLLVTTQLVSCVSAPQVSTPYRINGNTMVGYDLEGNTILYKTEVDANGNPKIVMYNLGHLVWSDESIVSTPASEN